jgi:hypothetical protein
MKSFHPFASVTPPSGLATDIKTSNWNDIHASGAVISAYAANALVPTSVDYIRGTGGTAGILLTLTSGTVVVVGPSGTFNVNQVYFAKKTDLGVGAVNFVDSAGALFEGQPTYALTQFGQWAIFIWNGVSWDVFGGMSQ